MMFVLHTASGSIYKKQEVTKLTGLAAGWELEGDDLPALVQLPYKTARLTHWCTTKTTGGTSLKIFGILVAMNAKYANVVVTDMAAAAGDTFLKELTQDVLKVASNFIFQMKGILGMSPVYLLL